MDEPVAVALKFGFLAVLYLFLLWMARSALKDLRRKMEAEGEPRLIYTLRGLGYTLRETPP